MRWSCGLPERALCWCLGFYTGQLAVLCPLGFPGSILLCTWLQVALLLCPGLLVGRLSHVACRSSCSDSELPYGVIMHDGDVWQL